MGERQFTSVLQQRIQQLSGELEDIKHQWRALQQKYEKLNRQLALSQQLLSIETGGERVRSNASLHASVTVVSAEQVERDRRPSPVSDACLQVFKDEHRPLSVGVLQRVLAAKGQEFNKKNLWMAVLRLKRKGVLKKSEKKGEYVLANGLSS